MSNSKKYLLIFVACAALAVAVIQIIHIGNTFEEKSLYSYMLKTGDTNPASVAAQSHISGMASYGAKQAIILASCSLLVGCIVGLLSGIYFVRRNQNAA